MYQHYKGAELSDQTTTEWEPANWACDQVVGSPTHVGEFGTTLAYSLLGRAHLAGLDMAQAFISEAWGGTQTIGTTVHPSPWRVISPVVTSSPTSSVCACRETGSNYGLLIGKLTSNLSLHSTAPHVSAPPVAAKSGLGSDGDHSPEQAAHAGIEVVLWIRELLGVSVRDAARVARVPVPTFYLWKKKPTSLVRPGSVARAFTVRATLEMAVAALGESEALRRLREGSPSLLEQLLADDVAWRDALQSVSLMAYKPPKQAAPRARGTDILARLAALEAAAAASEPDEWSGARQVSAEQLSEIEESDEG